MLPELSVSPLLALFHQRNVVVPPCPPWSVLALFHVVIDLQSATNRWAYGGHVSALAVAVGLTVGEIALVSAVEATVNARGWG